MSYVATWIELMVSGRKVSPGTKAVLDAIADDPERASYCSAQQLADVAEVNVATVVRAAQAMDFSGWTDLSTEVRNRYLSSLDSRKHFERNSDRLDKQIFAIVQKDVELMQVLLDAIDESTLLDIARSIAAADRTKVLATGAYTAPGILLAHNSQGLGYDVALSSGSLTSMVNDVRMLSAGDCLLAFSIWKTSTAVLHMAQIAKERGVKIFVIADQRSALARLADGLVLVPSEGLGSMPSVTCAISVVQCLVATLAGVDHERTSGMLADLDELWTRTNAVTIE